MKTRARIPSALTVALLLVLALLCAGAALAETEGDFTYEFLPDGISVRITAYTGEETVVTLPDELADCPVVSVGHENHDASAPVFPGAVTGVLLPETLSGIDTDAFAGLTGLTELNLPAQVEAIGEYAFSNCGLTEIELPAGIVSIGSYAFSGCALTRVELPEGLASVPQYAFKDCAALSEVALPQSLTAIEVSAFENTALTSIVLPEGLLRLDNRCFSGTQLTDVTLPASMNTSGGAQFNDCEDLLSITVLNDSMAAYNAPLTNVENAVCYVNPSSATAINLAHVGGLFRFTDRQDPRWRYILYSDTLSTSLGYGSGYTLALTGYTGADASEITLPEGAVMLGAGAFRGHDELTHIEIAASMSFIQGGAFDGLSALSAQEIPATVTRLGDTPFTNDPALRTITLSGANTLSDGALTDNTDAVAHAVPLSATTRSLGENLGHFDFVDLNDDLWTYRALSVSESVDLGLDSVPSLAAIAYRGTEAAHLTILDGVNMLGAELFKNHVELMQVDMPASLIVIDSRAFSQVEFLESIVVPEGVRHIGERAFDGCRKTSSVTLPSTFRRLDDYTFNGCLQVRGIELPDNMVYVGNNVLGESDVAGARTFSVNIASHTASLLGNYSFFYDKQNPEWRYRWVNEYVVYYDENDNWYYYSGLVLNRYLGSETEITVNDLVIGVDDYAFCVQIDQSSYSQNATLQKATFPTSVRWLGN